MHTTEDGRIICYGCQMPTERGWYLREVQFDKFENREPEYTVWTKLSEGMSFGEVYQARAAMFTRKLELKQKGRTYQGYDGLDYPRDVCYLFIGD